MVENYVCRLCVNPCNVYRNLIDINSGTFNVIYEIAAKYFDIQLFAPRAEFTTTCICIQCWITIGKFHDYQKAIWEAQSLLVKQELTVVNFEQETDEATSTKSVSVFDIVEINHDNQTTESNISQNVEQPVSEYAKSDAITSSVVIENDNDDHNTGSDFDVFEINLDIEETKVNITQNTAPETTKINQIVHAKQTVPQIKQTEDQSEKDDFLISRLMGDLECINCQQFLPSYTLLSKHFKRVHHGEECHIICCARKLHNRAEILLHLGRTHGMARRNTYKCVMCPASFTQYWSVRLHIRQCLAKVYKKQSEKSSEICKDKNFNTNTKQSVSSSNNNNTDITSGEEDALSNHNEESLDTIVQQFESSLTDYKDENDDYIAEWMGDLECIICLKFFGHFSKLSNHFKRLHRYKEFYVLCCSSKFDSRRKLVEHINQHHANLYKKTFKCDICNASFAEYKKLRLHAQRSHVRKNTTYYKCVQCSASFLQLWRLRYHMSKLHSSTESNQNLTKFTCDFCKNTFNTRTSLETHKKYHCEKLSNVNAENNYVTPEDDYADEAFTDVMEIDVPTTSKSINPDRDEDISLCSINSNNDEDNSEVISSDIGGVNKLLIPESIEILDSIPGPSNLQISPPSNVNKKFKKSIETDLSSSTSQTTTPQCPNLLDIDMIDSNSNTDRSKDLAASKHIQTAGIGKSKVYKICKSLDNPIAILKGRLICPHCKKLFINYSLLNSHFIEEHPKEKCYLICCSHKLYETATIVDHLRKFHQDILHKCLMCGASYIVHENLRKHIRLNHGVNKKIPNTMEKVQKVSNSLRIEKTTTFNTITILDKQNELNKSATIPDNEEIEIHDLTNDHQNNDSIQIPPLDVVTDTDDTISICSDDDDATLDMPTNINSMKSNYYSTVQSITRDDDNIISFMKGNLKCSQCKEIFEYYSLLETHFRIKHPLEQSYIVCCQTKFINCQYILEHLSSNHKDLREDFVHNSNESFIIPDNLDKKKQLILNVDHFIAQRLGDLKCPKCTEKFVYYESLAEHFCEKHPLVKFYISCCQLKFDNRHSIIEHLRNCHKLNYYRITNYQCDKCCKYFLDEHHLQRHNQKDHI